MGPKDIGHEFNPIVDLCGSSRYHPSVVGPLGAGVVIKNSHTLPDRSGTTLLSLWLADSSLIEDSSSAVLKADRADLTRRTGSDVIESVVIQNLMVTFRSADVNVICHKTL